MRRQELIKTLESFANMGIINCEDLDDPCGCDYMKKFSGGILINYVATFHTDSDKDMGTFFEHREGRQYIRTLKEDFEKFFALKLKEYFESKEL